MIITKARLQKFFKYSTHDIKAALCISGYIDTGIISSKFLGMTEGLFCYKVQFEDDGKLSTGNVYIKYDPDTEKISAEF
jgi:hypothetical protein